ncbi:unnamed protein product [Fusarium fujikuroi]|uniref:Uncharacterized protein n=1 Tax=Fusarium fujikuroi TaxID=5127 RepID=A0A9Q9RPJ9_FUSFU|nr:unnamed protein product [Fusarium fujikuroi]VZI15185.1 unnamed protein product [Fusarium fujikuroi]
MTEDVLYGRTGRTDGHNRSQDVQKVAGAANALAENEDAQAWAGGSAGIGRSSSIKMSQTYPCKVVGRPQIGRASQRAVESDRDLGGLERGPSCIQPKVQWSLILNSTSRIQRNSTFEVIPGARAANGSSWPASNFFV